MQCHGVWTELPLHWMKNNNSFIDINIMFTYNDHVPAGTVNEIALHKSCQCKICLKATHKKSQHICQVPERLVV